VDVALEAVAGFDFPPVPFNSLYRDPQTLRNLLQAHTLSDQAQNLMAPEFRCAGTIHGPITTLSTVGGGGGVGAFVFTSFEYPLSRLLVSVAVATKNHV